MQLPAWLLMMLGPLFLLVGSLIPTALGAHMVQQLVGRDRIAVYNVTFDSFEFDNLGDLDWRPLGVPFNDLAWKNFRVGANKHFYQISGGKNAFASIPLDLLTQEIVHGMDPALTVKYNESDITSFKLDSLSFGCALHSGIPVECNVLFKGLDSAGKDCGSHHSTFSPPYAKMNEVGRLEAGRSLMKHIQFDPAKYGHLTELKFFVQNFSVLYTPFPGLEDRTPADLDYSDSLLFVLDAVSYTANASSVAIREDDMSASTSASATSSAEAPGKTHELEKRLGGRKHVTDCFDNPTEDFTEFPIPYKDLWYDSFYRVNHIPVKKIVDCNAKNLNASTGHIYAPSVKRYDDPDSDIFPSIGIDYAGSNREDMSIKSFYLGCEQFSDFETMIESDQNCTIGILSLIRQKDGSKPQEVHYQEVNITKPATGAAEDAGFNFVELEDTHHITRTYFVLVSADPAAKMVAILVDNLTYYTRKWKWPRTGNKSIAQTNDTKIDGIVQAIGAARERSINPLGGSYTGSETGINDDVQTYYADNSTRRRSVPAPWGTNITLQFKNPKNVDPETGFFQFDAAYTDPLYFGEKWRGRAQDAQGNPAINTTIDDGTWVFAPVDPQRLDFVFAEVPISKREANGKFINGTSASASIRLSSSTPYRSFKLRRFLSGCHPNIISATDRQHMDWHQGETFECYMTVLGYKADFMAEPAEHVVEFMNGNWRQWRNWHANDFPKNFDNLVSLEFHVTYATTDNVRIFLDDIEIEAF